MIGLKKRISEEKTLKEITTIYINREMDEKDVKKIKAFVKKNSYTPYEIMKDSMLHKGSTVEEQRRHGIEISLFNDELRISI